MELLLSTDFAFEGTKRDFKCYKCGAYGLQCRCK